MSIYSPLPREPIKLKERSYLRKQGDVRKIFNQGKPIIKEKENSRQAN